MLILNTNNVKRNTWALLGASKQTDLEVNNKENKYTFLLRQ
jgi:hypothetical protein